MITATTWGAGCGDVVNLFGMTNSTFNNNIAWTTFSGASALVFGDPQGRPNTGNVFKISAGGPAASPFIADAGFTGGMKATGNPSGAVDTSLVTNPAPVSVYRSERYGTFTYTVSGLTASNAYTVNLHFTEDYWTAAGRRLENVSINGTQVLSGFDIFAAIGAQRKAIVKTFADANGNVAVSFSPASGSTDVNAKVDGVEVLAVAATPTPAPPAKHTIMSCIVDPTLSGPTCTWTN
jgi:Malectin domain